MRDHVDMCSLTYVFNVVERTILRFNWKIKCGVFICFIAAHGIHTLKLSASAPKNLHWLIYSNKTIFKKYWAYLSNAGDSENIGELQLCDSKRVN